MKKILEILFLASLAIFFLVVGTKEVFASSYMFVTVNLPGGGATGSQNPGFVSTSNTTYTHLIFGYTNLDDGIFDPGEKWRITADFCTLNKDFVSYFKYSEIGISLEKFDWVYGGQCFGTDKNGNVSVGVSVTYTVDFVIDDSPTGTLNLVLNKNGNAGTFFQFKSYRIVPPQELTILDGMNSITGSIIGSLNKGNQDIIDNATDNKDEIINNQDKNASDIMNNFTQNIQDQINNANKNQEETNKRLDGINDTLNDDTPPESDISGLGNVQGLLPPGPLDSLLNIPFQFLSILVSSFSGTCNPMKFNFVFDCPVEFPCFESFYDQVPVYLMIFLDTIPAGFMLIYYFKNLYKKIDRALSLETNTDDEWGVI